MIIAYFLLLVIAILFRVMHWPGVALILLSAPILLLANLLIQVIRKSENKESKIWLAAIAFLLSIYFEFKFLYWPGSNVILISTIAVTCVFIFRFYRTKPVYSVPLALVGVLFLFALYNATLTGSKFRMAYEVEDPFDPNQEVIPHFYRQRLAWDFYQEGAYEKAEKLIELNVDHLIELVAETGHTPRFVEETDEWNLEQSRADLEDIRHKNWIAFTPLIPEDRAPDPSR